MAEKAPARKAKKDGPSAFEKINQRKKGTRRFAIIQTDGDIAVAIEDAQKLVLQARARDRKEDKSQGMSKPSDKYEKAAKANLDKLLEKGRASEVKFWFKPIGRATYDALLLKHPPSDEQRYQGLDADLENFAPKLIAASSDDPKITVDEAHEIWDDPEWSPAECEKLYHAARNANLETPDIPLSAKGTDEILNSILK